MALQNPRGVITVDVPSSFTPVVEADAASIVFCGIAPVGSLPNYGWSSSGYASVVNVAVTCNDAVDFATQLGICNAKNADGTWVYGASELYDCAFIENNASPCVVINVFDPWKHSMALNQNIAVVNLEVAIAKEVILPSLTVTGTGGRPYYNGTDFSFSYDDDTLQSATLTVFSGSQMASETSVTCHFNTPNLSAITKNTIIGGVDPITGAYTGMEVIEHVPTDTNIIPAVFIAPYWSSDSAVCAAGIARAESISNGRYRAVFIADIDCSTSGVTNYTQLYAWKNAHNFVSDFLIAGWPRFTLSEKIYHFSTLYAVAHNITAAAFGNIPYATASNKHNAAFDGMVLADGKTRVRNDLVTMDSIENMGLISGVNDDGWTLIGDYLSDYPSGLQPYEMWTNERFMFNFLGNTLTRTLKRSIDMPGNLRTLATIGETIQQYGNHLCAVQAANTFRVVFDPARNLAQQVEAGIYVFTIYWTPPTPIRQLQLEVTYSVEDLAVWISNVTIPSTGTT
jgi:phage tail sheath protein FI